MGSTNTLEPLHRLLALEMLGIKVGLENIAALIEALGHPDAAYRSVIIAGTNGKGSVAAMVEAGLRAAGHRTGLYTSPHLVELEERFVVDGEPVDRRELESVAADVLDVADRLRAGTDGRVSPTFFEVATAVAFELFRRAGIDIAVLEVGLGGRFDATNVASPVAGAITSIAMDHERFLGSTLAEIAFEKAGIIKPGMPVVAGPLPENARIVVHRAAAERGARLLDAMDGVRLTTRRGDETCVRLATPLRDYGELRLALRGRHQVTNAVVATRLLEVLDGLGLRVPRAAVRRGLTRVRWRGRLEWLPVGSRRLLLDAAHNPAGARTLAAYLSDAAPRGLPLVFGAMRDKDTAGMLRELLPHATRLIVTRARSPRAQEPGRLADQARALAPGLRVDERMTVEAAIDLALAEASEACVAGSIFVLGEVLALVAAKPPGRSEAGGAG